MKKRTPVKKSVPEPVASVIDGVLQRTHTRLLFEEARFLKKCTERLGQDFCQHMKPYRFQNGVIHCIVDSPSWVQQYQFLSGEMKKRLNAPPMEQPIHGFRFTVGSILEAEYINKEQTAEKSIQTGLSPEEAEKLYKVVETAHPDLRDVLKSMIENWIVSQRNENRQDTTDEF